MESKQTDAPTRRRQVQSVKDAMRDLNGELAALNRRVGARSGLKDVDLEVLDLLVRLGARSPSALARSAGLHPATMTGVLDRLERAGWIAREPDPADRRGSIVRSVRDRVGEVFRLYAGMNSALDGLLGGYSDTELTAIADFVARAAQAGRAAADDLTGTS
ncbi:MarR family transcriptional regulator [Agromyces sp. Soil535]|uniref:MarR family transcriptional regulator n=1 Tax=Agromyces sp. Soil535 TaxID=1736390 RepID=UPI0006FB4318|nr:MarR family transcriptional regulator [Agromyces sp. Soil535]KRE22910.1 MarR family transcriptional regulator [Agromyces sp. Soil535]